MSVMEQTGAAPWEQAGVPSTGRPRGPGTEVQCKAQSTGDSDRGGPGKFPRQGEWRDVQHWVGLPCMIQCQGWWKGSGNNRGQWGQWETVGDTEASPGSSRSGSEATSPALRCLPPSPGPVLPKTIALPLEGACGQESPHESE